MSIQGANRVKDRQIEFEKFQKVFKREKYGFSSLSQSRNADKKIEAEINSIYEEIRPIVKSSRTAHKVSLISLKK